MRTGADGRKDWLEDWGRWMGQTEGLALGLGRMEGLPLGLGRTDGRIGFRTGGVL